MNRRFDFAPYKKGSKISCPQCGKPETLCRYIDLTTGDYLPNHVGMCDRIEKCGYKYTWWDYVRDEDINIHTDLSKIKEPERPSKYNTIPKKLFERSFEKQYRDTFSKFIIKRFGKKKAEYVLNLYKVGYASTWGGKDCTIFWQIDKKKKVRSGKIMAYQQKGDDIKRVKGKDKPLINWIHSYHKDDFILKQCFFGEHLLPLFPEKPVAIVEGEKTAIICAITYPKYLWLSSGMLHGINDDKMLPLKGRKIVLIPDKGRVALDIWSKKCEIYKEKGYNIFVRPIKSDILEDGDDIADYVLKAPVVE